MNEMCHNVAQPRKVAKSVFPKQSEGLTKKKEGAKRSTYLPRPFETSSFAIYSWKHALQRVEDHHSLAGIHIVHAVFTHNARRDGEQAQSSSACCQSLHLCPAPGVFTLDAHTALYSASRYGSSTGSGLQILIAHPLATRKARRPRYAMECSRVILISISAGCIRSIESKLLVEAK